MKIDYEKVDQSHVELALKRIAEEGLPDGFRPSRENELVHDGQSYPPIAVFAKAYLIATGQTLRSREMPRGEETPVFDRLREHGFLVKRKHMPETNSLTQKIQDFAEGYLVAKASMSRFSEQYEKIKSAGSALQDLLSSNGYKNLSIKSAIGMGTFADVPWICIFDDRITGKASDGHYPVYLFSADMESLYLAYCISNGMMTKSAAAANRIRTKIKDKLSGLTTLGFTEKIDLKSNLSTPRGYEKGTVTAKRYDLHNINPESFLTDLTSLLGKYQEIAESTDNTLTKNNIKTPTDKNVDLKFKLTSACSAKPFTILAGGTGTGKTRSAKLAATSISGSTNVEVVAVGADWTDNRPLLGFRNLLAEGGKTYVAPPALRIILKALEHPAQPHFLILDEMNLSHVERYFADFLSSMESKEPLKLHDSAENLKAEDGVHVPGKIAYPNNLFVIGTVNIDETTYMFSPKVLDRAHVIEFRVTWDEIANGLEGAVPREFPALRPEQVEEFMRISRLTEKALPEEDHELLTEVLEDLHGALEGTRFVFAHRTARECLCFIASAKALAKADIVEPRQTIELIDLAILQKALPKLNGASGTLSKVLEDLTKVADKHGLDLCKEKLESMSRQLKADHFVSFIQ
jgi:5-methylcytosine-specific restriction protein B